MTNRWTRIEGISRSDDLESGLQARVADPLWLLARQWQFGEFRGEDAARPVVAQLEVDGARIASLQTPGATKQSLDPTAPLEARVEADSVVDGPASFRIAAEAGLQFLRMLDAQGATGLRGLLREAFPLKLPDAIDPQDRIELALLARRSIDGRSIYVSREPVSALSGIPGNQRAAIDRAQEQWTRYYGSRFVEPDSAPPWIDERLEYGFSVAAPVSNQDDVVLTADEYWGGHLDWHNFDIDAAATHGTQSDQSFTVNRTLIPTPVGYAGMPARRWWQFEDAAVNFGGIEAGPADLARTVLSEFATVYSDDWYVVPIKLPVGSLNRVSNLTVIDTFGVVHTVESVAVNDGPDRVWRFFELSQRDGSTSSDVPWLLLPPALLGGAESRPVERTVLVRDELANLGWAIELIVEGETGRALRRKERWDDARERQENGAVSVANEDDHWRYRLLSSTPPYWIPLLPEREGEGASMRLRRARLREWDEIEEKERFAGAQGLLLAPHKALRLFEEEVPRGGIEVTRRYQMARSANGELLVWANRQKRPADRERSSGRRADVIEI